MIAFGITHPCLLPGSLLGHLTTPSPLLCRDPPQVLGPPVPLPHKLLMPGDSPATPMRTVSGLPVPVTWALLHTMDQHEVVSNQGSTWMADTFPLPGRWTFLDTLGLSYSPHFPRLQHTHRHVRTHTHTCTHASKSCEIRHGRVVSKIQGRTKS